MYLSPIFIDSAVDYGRSVGQVSFYRCTIFIILIWAGEIFNVFFWLYI